MILRLSVILLVSITLLSCKNTQEKIWQRRHEKFVEFEKKYDSEVLKIEDELKTKHIEEYIHYYTYRGNCFGNSSRIYHKYIWRESEVYEVRSLVRTINPKHKIQLSYSSNLNSASMYFLNENYKNLTEIPTNKDYYRIDPSSPMSIIYKTNDTTIKLELDEISNLDIDTSLVFNQFRKLILAE